MAKLRRFFTEDEEAQVVDAIRLAEVNTSGELRVHVEGKSGGNPYDRAVEVFGMLDMHKTEQRNGVLFYLATEDHQFTIIGDEGINNSVEEHFWEEIRDVMQNHFRNKDFVTGLSEGIKKSGEALAKYFPHQGDEDVNELSDDISTSDQ